MAGLGVLLSRSDAPDELARLLRLPVLLPGPFSDAVQGVREAEALLLVVALSGVAVA